jgi:hypothetical protein
VINYEPRTPRALVGFAAVFMTAATLAVAVLAPAASDVGSREVTVWTMSSDSDGAAANAAAPTTSINVVAVRGTRLVPVVQSRAASKTNLPG